MIFATIGTQLPFDRLLTGLDTWAAQHSSIRIVAQTGSTRRTFRHLNTVATMQQGEFRDCVQAARLVVAHAGMGTILSAIELGKPLIIMPRRAEFGEHRNDHQQETCREMSRLLHVEVVLDGQELHTALDSALARGFAMPPLTPTGSGECVSLLEALREFVWGAHAEPGHEARPDVRSAT